MRNEKVKRALALMLVVTLVAIVTGCSGGVQEGEVPVARGTPNVSVFVQQGGDKMVVASGGELEVQSGGTLDLASGSTVAIAGTTTFGVDGTAADVIFYSDTTGDYMRYDQSDEVLVITGTNAATALSVTDGNVVVADNVTVAGLSIRTPISVTLVASNTALTPAASVYSVTAAAAATITLAACSNNGQLLTFITDANQTFTIQDSNLWSHDGAKDTFGQYDVMSLICLNTKWHQLGIVAANS